MLAHPLLVPAIRLDRAEARDEETRRALERARAPWCAGFLLFGGEAEEVRGLTERLRDAAGRDLLVASDMERGAGQQVSGLPRLPEAGVFGRAASPGEVARAGWITARDARSVGVDVLFAPVLDVPSVVENPIVGERAFAWDPLRVATLGRAFLAGALAGGALPVAKHYPGHGATRTDSHVDVPVVTDDEDTLSRRDLLPFRAALAAGVCPAVMTAHVSYPALDDSGTIATFSRPVLDRLRGHARPREVVVFTDALLMDAACREHGTAGAARRALDAGADLLLYAGDEEAVARALSDVPADVLDERADRVARFLSGRAETTPASGSDAEALAREVATRAVLLSWWGDVERRSVLVLDDDGTPGRGEALAAGARRAGVPLEVLALGDEGVDRGRLAKASTLVLFASVRAAKGPGGLGPGARRTLERLASLCPRPRLLALGAFVPEADVHLPGTHPALEAALALRLFDVEGT